MRSINNISPFGTALFIFGLMVFQSTSAQNTEVKEEPPIIIEEQLENLTEMNDDEAPEDDEWLQDMVYFSRNPVNLNYADEGLLQQLKLLSPVEINNLVQYRNAFGPLLHIYELQAVPGWSIMKIRRLLPYITVSENVQMIPSLRSRLEGGEHVLLLRTTRVLEKSKGYRIDATEGRNYYMGSPLKLLLRYKYKFKNNLQFGITAEKDAGEQFFRGAQSSGFDFYSAHFFARDIGVIRTVALGDFTVNMGQGLIQWQGLSFTGGAEIMNIKRQSEILRPHSSAGEVAFHRGAGVTVQKNNIAVTAFGSYRFVDAGTERDTLNRIEKVTSLRTSGLHRTPGEVAGRKAQEQFALGGTVKYEKNGLVVGVNAIAFSFGHPVERDEVLYNKFVFRGRSLQNYSLDYGYTYKNMHLFGEVATDMDFNKALIGGLVVSATSRVDMSFLYRNISSRYQSVYSGSFTVNSRPNNERGFYSGLSIVISDAIRLLAYADIFSFLWLKYRVDAPSEGSDYMLQFNYRPARNVEIYSRFRSGHRPINDNKVGAVTNPVLDKRKLAWRAQFSYKVHPALTVSSRLEVSRYDHRGPAPQNGFLLYAGLQYKALLKPWAANMRVAFFETDSYDTRLYAYENDVLYGYSIPAIYGKGYRYYFNVKYRVWKGLDIWMRFAQTIFTDRETIGSGLDEIKGNKKSEIKVQMMWHFSNGGR